MVIFHEHDLQVDKVMPYKWLHHVSRLRGPTTSGGVHKEGGNITGKICSKRSYRISMEEKTIVYSDV